MLQGPDHGIGLRPLVGTPRVSRTGKETGTARPMGGMRSETGLASQRQSGDRAALVTILFAPEHLAPLLHKRI